MNGLAQQQGRYFHEELLVNNAAQPQYPLVTVTAETATSITSEHGHVFVPKSVVNYQHDVNGNLVSDGRWNYIWDLENRLVGMETLSSVPDGARRKLTFRYDYMGRRFYKSSRSWDAVTGAWSPAEVTRYVYDEWNLVAEIKNDIVVKRYTWGLDLSGMPQGAGGVGGLLSVAELQPDSTWKVNYAISDANGNVMKLVDAQTLATEAEYEYGPFGELIRMTGSRAKANPFRFSSKYQDDESGLLYYGYRYYDAQVGRWLNKDPIEEAGGLGLYIGSSNDFINRADIVGLKDFTFGVNTQIRRWHAGFWDAGKGLKSAHAIKVNSETGKITDEVKFIGDSIVVVAGIDVIYPGKGNLNVSVDFDKCKSRLKVHFTGTVGSTFPVAKRLPDIDYDFLFDVQTNSPHGRFVGQHDAFPSYSAWFRGSATLNYDFEEVIPAFLFPPMDVRKEIIW